MSLFLLDYTSFFWYSALVMDDDLAALAKRHERCVNRLQAEVRMLQLHLDAKLDEVEELQKKNTDLRSENARLRQRVAELTGKAKPGAREVPAFVKPNVPEKRRRKPGRPKGHPAAVRPMPKQINVNQEVALPRDEHGKPSCPHCHTQLSQLKHHRRVVEDIVPAKLITTCYHTHSGYCPGCRRRVESRAKEQPPAANLQHAQFGLNALATAAVLRVCYRLPVRQVALLFKHLPGLTLSPATVTKQINRMSEWLEGEYDRLQLVLRAAGVVHADETGWRIDGKNGYLWTLTNETHTLFHVDRSRSGKVIASLLGETFDGTLVSDFYAVYDQFDCKQQKCLTHLLRELRDTVAKQPEFETHPFFKGCKRLVREMLRLKNRQSTMQAAAYARQVKSIETRLTNLSLKSWDDDDAERLGKRLRKYKDRLTPFLHDPAVDGTNNAAERALRPAVVMRKITGGSRSETGAHAWAVLASVMRTAEQQGHDVVETIKTLLQASWAGENIALLTDIR